MPLIVACSHCQTRYNLPEKLHGKKLKCKSCSKPFLASASAKHTTGGPAKQAATRTPKVDAQELSNMGIDEIRQNDDPFATPIQNGPDVLGNHVVADPGFDLQGPGDEIAEVGLGTPVQPGVNDDGDYALQSVVSNPYIRSTPKPSHHAAVDDEAPRKRAKKKRKKKVHPAVKDSLDKATMTLLIVGVLIAMLFGFFFISAHGDAMSELKHQNLFAVEDVMTEAEMEEAAIERAFVKRVFFGIGISIGLWFMLLGLGVQFFPITCSITGLASYVFFELLLCVFLLDFLSITGWIRRIFVCGALGKAFMDATNARQHELRMAERRALGK